MVSVNQIDYLHNVSMIINQYSPRVVQNYLVWCFVFEMLDYMPKRFQMIKQNLNDLMLGTSGKQSRSIECSTSVNNVMGFAISRLYIEKYFSEQTRNQVEYII